MKTWINGRKLDKEWSEVREAYFDNESSEDLTPEEREERLNRQDTKKRLTENQAK